MRIEERTRISMIKTRVENAESGAPRDSTVMFPGQSQISNGIMVLYRWSVGWFQKFNEKYWHVLVSVFYDAHSSIKIKGLFGDHAIEKDLLNRSLSTSTQT